MVFQKGQQNYHKLTREQVEEIRAARAALSAKGRRRVPNTHPSSYRSLAAKYGVSRTTIESVMSRRTWGDGAAQPDKVNAAETVAVEPAADSCEDAC